MRYEGSAHLSEVPRALVLHATGEVVSEQGYGRLTVTRLTSRSGVSLRTFRDLFDGTEDCFLQAFEEAAINAEGIAKYEYSRTAGAWRVKVRAALAAVLAFLDERADARALLISEPGKAGPRVAERYAQTVRRVGRVLHESARGVTRNGDWLTAQGGECSVQSVLSLVQIFARGERPESLSSRLNILMGTLVLRYEGPEMAELELAHTECEPSVAPKPSRIESEPRVGPERPSSPSEVLRSLNLRVTFRKLRVLEAIAGLGGQEGPYPSNREIADAADITDHGQMSKLLRRMQEQGLVQEVSGNAGRQTGFAYAWRLSQLGQELLRTIAQPPSSGDRVRGDERREARR